MKLSTISGKGVTKLSLLLCLLLVGSVVPTRGTAPLAGSITPAVAASIDVQPSYQPYKPIVATIAEPATAYLWDWPETFEFRQLEDGRVLHIWAAPGKHELRCILLTIDWDQQTFDCKQVRAEFEVLGDGPDPPPAPANCLYLIHESGDSTPETAMVRDARRWKDEAVKLDLAWLVADDDVAAKLLPKVVKAARKIGLPAVVFCDQEGEVVQSVAMPNTTEKMLELVRQYGKGLDD